MAPAIPHVKVLLATYNGARWLDEQLDSIVKQIGVHVTVVASDDSSTDETVKILERWSANVPVDILPSSNSRFGCAHRNFLRLIRDAEPGDADFFALADQDDLWLPQKLHRATECLSTFNAQGYSSNVVAFWPDRRQQIVNKALSQQPLDYLFESPGPGCTFVLPRLTFLQLKAFVTDEFDRLQEIWVHDWLIYAFVRSRGGLWHIDAQPLMLYRQHSSNEIGVNTGWRAAVKRWKLLRSGKYRRDVLAIAKATNISHPVVNSLRRFNAFDRVMLLLQVRAFRRRFSECLALAVFFC